MSNLPAQDICYAAVEQNDMHYDGRFVVGVTSTRIYCRPSCRAKTPKRENMRFFRVAAAAEAQGFRACKRCFPQEVSPADEQARLVQQICKYIDQNLEAALTLNELGEAIGWSPYHLQRTFKQVMGITPRQYTEARRMACFKANLKNGKSVTNAAVTAGYSSFSRLYSKTDSNMGMTPSVYQQGGEDTVIAFSMADSPVGKLLVAMTERGVCSVMMGEDASTLLQKLGDEFPAAAMVHDDETLAETIKQILAYLDGWQPHLDLPLDIRLTAFQKRVLDELKKIPYGETRTYGEIAQAIGNPKAARAVGQACGANPVPLIIPCHRVIRSDGRIEGYAYGTVRKVQLLDMEKEKSAETG